MQKYIYNKKIILLFNILLLATLAHLLDSSRSLTERDRVMELGKAQSDTEISRFFSSPPDEDKLFLKSSQDDYNKLIQYDLFGIAANDISEPTETTTEIEEETVFELPQIELLGTVAGTGQFGRAFLNVENASEERRIFRIGDRLGELTLTEIGPRTVIFTRNGESYEIGVDFISYESQRSSRTRRETRTDSGTSAIIVRRGGTDNNGDNDTEQTERDRGGRGRWRDIDDDERERRLEALRERRERMLEEADPETRERIIDRFRRVEERLSEQNN